MKSKRPFRVVEASLWIAVTAMTLTTIVSLSVWRWELREIRQIVSSRVDPEAPEDEIIRAARRFLEYDVGYERPDAHFLAPIFSFMRPTALQVIRQGGDCSYRTRAFIVILRLYDIEASKLALHNDDGVPVHSVAEVRGEDDPYYVDLLFNIAHEDEDGAPLSLSQLEDKNVLAGSVQRAVARGNDRASRYPLQEYDFEDWRTINWEKNAVLSLAYDGLVALMGEEGARRLPRPYLSEEPALMVVVLCTGGSLTCLLLIVGVGHRRSASRGPTTPESSPHGLPIR